jgi:glutamate synthase domain-containing protein 2
MMRIVFYIIVTISSLLTYLIYRYESQELAEAMLFILVPYTLIGMYDILQKKHTILRMYPVIGHIRYILEYIRPEIRQYFISSDNEELPFNREVRNIVYQRSKNALDTLPFGTRMDVKSIGYHFCKHSMVPKIFSHEETRVKIGGSSSKKPYSASILNISAMSFGALSSHAIKALNQGAKKGSFLHNTGEGGLSPYHEQGGDLCFQLGTGYFGCRDKDGRFDPNLFKSISHKDHVKMIELKISQGAKPSHGGILPKAKISEEISRIRGISMDQDCVSPPSHTEFDSPLTLLKFIEKLRKLSGGKPIGFKLCIGKKTEFMSICKAMLKLRIYPDFITVDGAEGGTGAAPLEFSNRLGVTIDEAIIFVNQCLVGVKLRDKIKIIASGKVATGFDVLEKLAIGADLCNAARPMMFALGCIQSLSCHNNTCPTGIATQSKLREKSLVVADKATRVYRYHKNTVHSFCELAGAMGLEKLDDIDASLLLRRSDRRRSESYEELFPELRSGELLSKKIHEDFEQCWKAASAESF